MLFLQMWVETTEIRSVTPSDQHRWQRYVYVGRQKKPNYDNAKFWIFEYYIPFEYNAALASEAHLQNPARCDRPSWHNSHDERINY